MSNRPAFPAQHPGLEARRRRLWRQCGGQHSAHGLGRREGVGSLGQQRLARGEGRRGQTPAADERLRANNGLKAFSLQRRRKPKLSRKDAAYTCGILGHSCFCLSLMVQFNLLSSNNNKNKPILNSLKIQSTYVFHVWCTITNLHNYFAQNAANHKKLPESIQTQFLLVGFIMVFFAASFQKKL